MALKIVKQIEDASGTIRSELYTNIGKRYIYDKRLGTLFTSPEYWASEDAYKNGKSQIYMTKVFADFSVKVEDASVQLLFDFLYTPYIAALVSQYGLVQGELFSDKTGVWQEVTIN